jgi:hypothetical protein
MQKIGVLRQSNIVSNPEREKERQAVLDLRENGGFYEEKKIRDANYHLRKQKVLSDKVLEYLYSRYVVDRESSKTAGDEIGVSSSTVMSYAKKRNWRELRRSVGMTAAVDRDKGDGKEIVRVFKEIFSKDTCELKDKTHLAKVKNDWANIFEELRESLAKAVKSGRYNVNALDKILKAELSLYGETQNTVNIIVVGADKPSGVDRKMQEITIEQ